MQTSRLTLRRFSPADAPDLSRVWSDPEVFRYLPFSQPRTPEQAGRSIAFFEDHWAQYSYGVWAVLDKTSGEFLGYCGLRYLEEVSEVEVLYGFAQLAWGKGIATEAAKAAVDFGFAAGLQKIIALAVPENIASRRVMEKLGMKQVGQKHMFGLDVVQYELLVGGRL